MRSDTRRTNMAGDEQPNLVPSNAPVPPRREVADGSYSFECNICLDHVKEPVVTLCGHLYCWSCLYRWISRNNQCPVCKAGVTQENVIPVYGRGSSAADPSTLPILTMTCPTVREDNDRSLFNDAAGLHSDSTPCKTWGFHPSSDSFLPSSGSNFNQLHIPSPSRQRALRQRPKRSSACSTFSYRDC
ncbi:hypothetical protein H310_01205 [Aphanomyces invadans]|uniref:RING-type E3 ubiquitin transferase n=1 Tax=Aphanomyces invadans TaxID=157072 RepID=A0A024UR62_9STRA|nr:hypothetical protein H310_01205 [Aphanomyces invadans]ETW08675.1 hypothetical protein H310_01205 [Aphanomyces invadans]|eukprot:XP_008862480.1 hypothetical protein H310_01205 [Aphanomyces invadans]